ncbi:MAG: 50S ribosomal protein L15 [Pseudomonadota bacterium]|jgi:large subunit ribosomal protein L15|nr:50S ribosomal protein L15 [Pseudomonadota bacterium]MEC7787748.1 50S ribosomal protein L15 [Pseudomonadota bacterium]MEC8146908.1 50S ribosomal protein L15 [Pseudomonadota bacterium]MEC8169200.1 50S ribosomal protein L15 [Pseudomonadota bacterium]MEC8378252.1 50S ribosomal protein L15 [Pseudomonadota bacterium]|tara:strand:+ start:168 stop:596 length:429 start_codon:yes stop_codon:yes gene_type:complete
MSLNKLNSIASNKSSKRVGRGSASGSGKTSGRGHKGQKARSGGRVRPGFEGGQMPIQQRLPKFGFTSKKANLKCHIKIRDLEKLDLEIIDLDSLKSKKIIKNKIQEVKVVLGGELTKSLKIKGLKVSKAAREEITSKGGEIT